MYHSRIDKIKPPLDPSFYKLADDEAAFYKAMTGIQDAEELKRHILSVQAKAYDVRPLGIEPLTRHWVYFLFRCAQIFGYPCIRRCAFLKWVAMFSSYQDPPNWKIGSLKISRLPAYKQVLKLGQERWGAILLDMGCCCILTSERPGHELTLDVLQLEMM